MISSIVWRNIKAVILIPLLVLIILVICTLFFRYNITCVPGKELVCNDIFNCLEKFYVKRSYTDPITGVDNTVMMAGTTRSKKTAITASPIPLGHPIWFKLKGDGGGAWWPAKLISTEEVFFWSDGSRATVIMSDQMKPFEHARNLIKCTRGKIKDEMLKKYFEVDLEAACALLDDLKSSRASEACTRGNSSVLIPASHSESSSKLLTTDVNSCHSSQICSPVPELPESGDSEYVSDSCDEDNDPSYNFQRDLKNSNSDVESENIDDIGTPEVYLAPVPELSDSCDDEDNDPSCNFQQDLRNSNSDAESENIDDIGIPEVYLAPVPELSESGDSEYVSDSCDDEDNDPSYNFQQDLRNSNSDAESENIDDIGTPEVYLAPVPELSESGDIEYVSDSCDEFDDEDNDPSNNFQRSLRNTNSDAESESIGTPKVGNLEYDPTKTVHKVKQLPLNQFCDHPVPEEEHIVRDQKCPEIFIRKGRDTIKESRIYNNYHCCLVCKRILSNIRKHLPLHSTVNTEIEKLAELKRNGSSKLASKMQTLLINKGDHEHNVEVLKNKSGELIIARRQTPFCAKEYGPCPLCLEWLKINVSTTRHQNTCVKRREEKLKKGDAQVRSSVILGLILPSASKRLLEEVYPIMTNDDLTSIAQSDPLIVGLGNYWLRENVGNKLKRKYYTSTKMRGAARLLKFLECNSKESQCSSMSDFMKPCKFDEVVSAGMQCGTIDADDEEELKHPSAVIKIKFDISRMANFKIGMAVRERNTEIQKDCTDFLFLLKTEWSNKVTKIATQLLRERRMQKGVLNVNPIDLQKIAEYLKKKLRDFQLKIGETDPTLYRDVAQYTLARLLTYNKRRSGELEQMLLKNYESRSTQIDDADHELMGDLTKTEKLLLGSQEIIKIQGKAGHVVPVLVPLDVSKALQYLTEKEVRVKAGVKQGNIYVFANTGNLVHRAYDALKRVCLEAEVACPDRITSVTLRKYFATMTQVLGMQDHQVQWMCKHLGHSFNVHKLHYRSMSEYIERINMGKMMLIQDFNAAPRFKGKNIEDISVEDIIQEADKLSLSTTGIDCSVENTTANIAEKERLDTEQDSLISDQEDDQPPSQKKRKVVRQKWNVVEMEEIRRYFADNLQSGKCPGFKAIQKAMALSKSVDGLLHLRAWDNIKKKVWNMAKKSSLEHGKEI